MPKIKNSGLDQYGAEPLKQQQYGTAGTEWVKIWSNQLDPAVWALDNTKPCTNTQLMHGFLLITCNRSTLTITCIKFPIISSLIYIRVFAVKTTTDERHSRCTTDYTTVI